MADATNTESVDYESMDYGQLTELSASLDAERAALNERIAEVNEVRGRKEVAELAAQRAADTGEGLSIVEAQQVAAAGAESAEGVGAQ